MFADSDYAASDDYWSLTRRPLSCLMYLLPMLVLYEVGIIWIGGSDPDPFRNGADFWMRGWLTELGLTQALLLPALVVTGLMVWHFAGKFPWEVSLGTLAGMFAESLLFAFLLIVAGQIQDLVFRSLSIPVTLSMADREILANAVTYFGAGIYEEVLFRLCLLPICYGFFRLTRLSVKWSAVLAILTSSLTFSLAHYVGPAADSVTVYSFIFRSAAGIFFAWLFCVRGFGITVGCHTAYDLLVGIVLVEYSFS